MLNKSNSDKKFSIYALFICSSLYDIVRVRRIKMAQISTRKRGNTWEYSFEIGKINGKRKRQSKGGFRTKKECLEAGTKAKAEYDGTGEVFKPSEITVNDYFDEWYNSYVISNCKPLTIASYERTIRVQIKPYFGNMKLRNVTPKVCQDFMNHLQSKGIAYSYIKMIRVILHGALEYAVFPLEYIKSNPSKLIRVKFNNSYNEKPKLESLTPEQFNLIINSLKSSIDYFKIPLYIGWYMGMRCGEVLGLNWSDIDFENKTITVNKALIRVNGQHYINTTKTKYSDRVIMIPDALVEILQDWKVEQGKMAREISAESPTIVCTNRQLKRVTNSYVTSRCCTISKELNIDFHFHLLRHSHATLLIQNGASIKDVQLRLGHGTIKSTLDIYTHYNRQASERSIGIIDDVFKVDKR